MKSLAARPLALAVAAVVATAAASGCNTGFEPQYRVTDLRILAVGAEVVGTATPPLPPFADAQPGDALQLRALVANPRGRAPLSVRWYLCAPTGTDRLPPCLDEELLKDPSRIAALASRPGSGVFALGEGVAPAPIPIPAVTSGALDVTAALAALVRRAEAEPTYQCALYAEIPVLVVAEAEGRREVAVKRVRVKPRAADLPPSLVLPDGGTAYTRNRNPAEPQVLRGPTSGGECSTPLAGSVFPEGRVVLCGAADAPGGYNVCGPEGERTLVSESHAWQWFVTAGEFPEFDGIGNADTGQPEFERPAGPFTLWVVLRDGRGGESWSEVRVAP